jgi:cytochrome b561
MNSVPAVYSGGSRFLHWIIAALILLGLIPIGLTMVSLEDGMLKNFLYEVHKSFGMIVFTLAVMRVVVRVAQGFPPLPDSMPEWQKIAARATHLALYTLIVTVPVLGYTGTAMCCAPVSLFWTIPIPISVERNLEQAEIVLAWHKSAVFLMAGILALHVGAALWHRSVRRDGVFGRMWRG